MLKKFIKNTIVILLIIILIAVTFSGCSGGTRNQDGRISIISTIFPHYDWVRQIIGEENINNFDLTLLLDNQIDLHNYNPSAADIAKIANCDVFIYVGGHSDDWVDSILKQAVNADMLVINLIDLLGDMIIYDDEHDDHDDDHDDDDDDHDDDDDDDHDDEIDEHIWLSLSRAKLICEAIAEMLSETDPDNAAAYKANADAYIAKLSALHAEYQAAVDASNVRMLVFADRFPFRYLVDDYGLDYHAAFSGCSSETEASIATIVSMAESVDRFNLSTVIVTESSDQSIARTVIDSTAAKNQNILVLNALQSVTADDVRNGAAYLDLMQNNLDVLKEALK